MKARLTRLKRRAEFLRVAGGRRKWAAPGLLLQACRREADDDGIRVGFTASRKVGGAVIRNRARRRLRAAAERILPCHAARGTDYVLIARADTPTRPFAALLADLETALKRIGAWEEASSCR
ncbi:MAG: ribonuclease P protein component [Rhodospirillales bacterium]|nr:ribonuclease P protein component [Rhodospirillales bacterium]